MEDTNLQMMVDTMAADDLATHGQVTNGQKDALSFNLKEISVSTDFNK